MYTYHKKKQYNVMEYNFDSIAEFIDYLDNTPVRSDIFKALSSETGDYDFVKQDHFLRPKNFVNMVIIKILKS